MSSGLPQEDPTNIDSHDHTYEKTHASKLKSVKGNCHTYADPEESAQAHFSPNFPEEAL